MEGTTLQIGGAEMIKINGQVYDGVIIKPDLDDSLKHYGVKGMKWTKRKAGAKSIGSKIHDVLNADHYDEFGNSSSPKSRHNQ